MPSLDRRAVLGSATLAIPVLARAQPKPRLVLVHGAFEDASCWAGVLPLLEAAGVSARAVNLPGRAPDPTPPGSVTLDAMRDAVVAALAEGPPAVLVGHSFGGIVVSAAAEAAPERVRRLVYLAAYLPRDGESLQTLAARDPAGELGPGFVVDGPAGVARVREDLRAPLFCGGCDAATAAAVSRAMVAEPLAPTGTPVRLTPERFGRVEKAYIRTARDRVVSPALQSAMLEGASVGRVSAIDAGHAPHNASPGLVASALVAAAA